MIKKEKLIAEVSKKAKITPAKAKLAYETILKENPSFRKQSVKTVKAKDQVAVKVAGKQVVKKVNLKREVPVERVVEKVKKVEVIKEVPVEIIKEVIKEVKVVKEIPVEVIKEVTLIKEVQVEKIVEKKVVDAKALAALKSKLAAADKALATSKKSIAAANKALADSKKSAAAANAKAGSNAKAMNAMKAKYAKEIADYKKKLAAKPRTIEVVKEIPVEVIKEVEVVKSIDMNMLRKMMTKMGTVQVSKKVVGETRNKKEGKIVSRREVKGGSSATVKKAGTKKTVKKSTAKKASASKAKARKDDLTKIEGVGPKIAGLLNAAKITTFAQLSKAKASAIKTVLDKAGPRFQMHDPGSWPKQAGLAAAGKWADLKKLQDVLSGGK